MAKSIHKGKRIAVKAAAHVDAALSDCVDIQVIWL